MQNQNRKEEIRKKQAKLLELKALRAQKLSANRQIVGASGDVISDHQTLRNNANSPKFISPTPNRADKQKDLDDFINSIVEASRPGSTGPGGASSPAHKGSRPNSVLSENSDLASPANSHGQTHPVAIKTLSTVSLATVYEIPPSPVKEVFSYSKGVQTTEEWSPRRGRSRAVSDSENDDRSSPLSSPSASKRLSRREREREEVIRRNLRKEIEEEIRTAKEILADDSLRTATEIPPSANFPGRSLTNEELNAVISSDEFMEFVEKSTKVIERALDQEYDILADYSLSNVHDVDENDEVGNSGKGRRLIREVAQFYDERWSKKRMISAVNFSPKFSELVLAAYTKNPSAPHDPDGLVQVWNLHLHDRPEFIFHAQSDVLMAKFSPFHPNLIVGGAYSGQVLLWDTRAKSAPVLKTPLTSSGHTHPVYSVDIVGTQNANNIISCSTDGVVCGWTVDMLTQPQELLTLTTPPPSKIEDLSPTCMAFPQTDPTYFLVGSEEGTIFPCHRYDRAGAKAGIDQRVSYRGHAAPVMSMSFHPARGPIDLGDLIITSSLDWSVKLWKIRAPAATSTTGITGEAQSVSPLLDLTREDVVYDAAWSPIKPGVFSLVDGAGNIEVWDLTVDTEVPMAKAQPVGQRGGARSMTAKSLNRVAWDETEGKRLATGGIDGAVTVFEVAPALGGKDSAKNEEWTSVKKLVARLESTHLGINGIGNL